MESFSLTEDALLLKDFLWMWLRNSVFEFSASPSKVTLKELCLSSFVILGSLEFPSRNRWPSNEVSESFSWLPELLRSKFVMWLSMVFFLLRLKVSLLESLELLSLLLLLSELLDEPPELSLFDDDPVDESRFLAN